MTSSAILAATARAGKRADAGDDAWCKVDETLATGFDTPEKVVRAWLDSPIHRAVLLSPACVDDGVGHARDSASRHVQYWVANFGRLC